MRVAVAWRRKSLRKSASTFANGVSSGIHTAVAVARARVTSVPAGAAIESAVEPAVQTAAGSGETAQLADGASSGPSGDRGTDAGPDESAVLLRRAPSGYLWNQLYYFWPYVALLGQTLVITAAVSINEKGVYTAIERSANFAVALAALGLESAAYVFVPRALESNRAQVVGVALRLIVLRVAAVLAMASLILWALPGLASLLNQFALPGGDGLLAILDDPRAQGHLAALAGYVVAVGLGNITGSILTALLRTRIIFIVGGIAQVLILALPWIFVVRLRLGADGAMWALTIPNAVMALIYGIVLIRVLGIRAGRVSGKTTLGMLRLSGAAWLSDLPSGQLISALAIAQLGALVLLSHPTYDTTTALSFFGLAFQLGDGATMLLVSGLSGVGLAVAALAYAKRNLPHLGVAWRTLSKIQILLGVPLIAFLIPHSDGIIHAIITIAHFPQGYVAVGIPLALYLGLSALTRMAGGGTHTAILYVVGKSQWVVFSNWLAVAVVVGLDILLIPVYGVAGALIAVGVAKFLLELIQLLVAQHALKRPFPIAFLLRVLLALAPAVAFAFLWRPTSLLPLFVAGLAFTVLFLLGLLVVRPLDAEDGALLDQVTSPLHRLLLPLVARNRGVAAEVGVPSSAEPMS